ncbi:MAG TPA: hypothetical protein VD767_07510 [Thermomicrobiales bacterium]|nr:hypothetical protein [Thermomicrobiales bacterium]
MRTIRAAIPAVATFSLSGIWRLLQRSGQVEVLFLDEMGFTRWPEPGRDWGPVAPAPGPRAERQQAPNRLWRIAGARNAQTGQVTPLDGSIVGRRQLGQFARLLDAT